MATLAPPEVTLAPPEATVAPPDATVAPAAAEWRVSEADVKGVLRESLLNGKQLGRAFELLMLCNGSRASFTRFLASEYSDENMLFWLACQDYRGEPALNGRRAVAQEMYVSSSNIDFSLRDCYPCLIGTDCPPPPYVQT